MGFETLDFLLLSSKESYFEAVPMGFETSYLLTVIEKTNFILKQSLWDLKRRHKHGMIIGATGILKQSLWNLKHVVYVASPPIKQLF